MDPYFNSYTYQKLPKSCKRVILVLENKGGMTQRDLIDETKMPSKTVRFGLTRLMELGLVISSPYLNDLRSQYYQLNPDYPFQLMTRYIEEAQKILVE